MPTNERINQALRCIRNHIVHSGKTPSVRDFQECMGFKSPRSAAVLLEKLIEGGYLVKKPDGRIQLKKDPVTANVRTVDVPIVGMAPCGSPMLAEENIEGVVRVDVRLAKPPARYFILRAQGDSMNRAGIDDGDLVLVKSTPHAEDGDRVVALVDGESTIKILRRQDDVAILQPASTNRQHHPIFADSELSIQGVVVSRLSKASVSK